MPSHFKSTFFGFSSKGVIPIQIQLIFKTAKLSTDVATSTLVNKIVIEVNYRGRSFEVNQSGIDINARPSFNFQSKLS